MARFASPYPYEGRPIGFSWPSKLATADHKDPRFRVHINCLKMTDEYDVVIVSVPPEPSQRPRCDRCGHLISL